MDIDLEEVKAFLAKAIGNHEGAGWSITAHAGRSDLFGIVTVHATVYVGCQLVVSDKKRIDICEATDVWQRQILDFMEFVMLEARSQLVAVVNTLSDKAKAFRTQRRA